jgi:hypothetical protein
VESRQRGAGGASTRNRQAAAVGVGHVIALRSGTSCRAVTWRCSSGDETEVGGLTDVDAERFGDIGETGEARRRVPARFVALHLLHGDAER